MASGILGSAVAGGATVTVTMYTCPVGISHAVVHLYGYSSVGPGGNISLDDGTNEVTVVFLPGPTTVTNPQGASLQASVMVGPGQSIKLNAGSTSVTRAVVTGYEVL